MMSQDSAGDFLAGFLIGAVVGAAAALLLAPQSGQETRTRIRETGLELRDKAEELSAEARREAERLAEEATKKAQEAQQRGRIVLDEQKTKVHDLVEKGKEIAAKKKAAVESEA
jgi:gas vesicle protein